MKQVNVKIPETLNDLTLGQYQEVLKYEGQEDIDKDFLMRKVVKIVYGIPMNEFDNIVNKDVDVLISSYNTVVKKAHKFTQRFELNGAEYGIIPNFDNISFGEWCDMNEYSKTEDQHRLMSILYRRVTKKKGKRYSIEAYNGSHERFKAMPLGIALGAVAFFLRISIQLLSDTVNSLTEEEQRQMVKRGSTRNGDGTQVSTPSAVATS